MPYTVPVTILAWGAILVALRVYLPRLKAPRWVNKTVNVSAATIAVSCVTGVVLYAELYQLLAEGSMLWAFS